MKELQHNPYIKEIEVQIRLFASFRDYLPEERIDPFSFKKAFKEGTTIREILEELGLPEEIPKLVVVKGNQVREDYVLQDGDVVSIFPPISGG